MSYVLYLFTLQLTCEKDVGMELCTFNFVFRLSVHLVCLLFGTSSLHLLNFFENLFIRQTERPKNEVKL